MADEMMMHIGELAERTGLSLRTLRHWDEVGLVRASGRTSGGFRLYTTSDEQRVMLVRSMKPMGFTLEEMAELVRAADVSPSDPLAEMEPERASYFLVESIRRRDKLIRHLEGAEAFVARIS